MDYSLILTPLILNPDLLRLTTVCSGYPDTVSNNASGFKGRRFKKTLNLEHKTLNMLSSPYNMSKARPQCGLILENNEGKILLQLRDNEPDLPYPDCWGTFGGQIEEGETPEEAIRREIKEELNYVLKDAQYFGNFPFDGYNIYMFRKVDPGITMQNLTVREGQKGEFLTLAEVTRSHCAFNCKDIVAAYFQMFQK